MSMATWKRPLSLSRSAQRTRPAPSPLRLMQSLEQAAVRRDAEDLHSHQQLALVLDQAGRREEALMAWELLRSRALSHPSVCC